MESKQSMEKILKYQKVLSFFYNMTWVIGSMALAALVIVNILYFANVLSPETASMNLQFNMLGLQLNIEGSLLGEGMKPAALILTINALYILALLIYVMKQLRAVFKSFIENSTPFMAENITRIKNIAYGLYVYSGVVVFTEVFTGMFMKGDIVLKGIEGISITSNVSLPLWPIVCGIVISGIAEIFQHGLNLQKDSDSIV